MRIRTLLVACAVGASVLTGLILGGLVYVTRQAQIGFDDQQEAQQVARDVANMLSLTNEFSLYGGERAISQWRLRHQQLASTIEGALARRQQPSAELVDLKNDIADLPLLFEKLTEIGPSPASLFDQRRRDLLLERLLAQTQELVESRHRWALAISASQRRDQRLYTGMVVLAPGALVLLLLALGVLVARKILRPLAQLKSAAVAMQAGDLEVRCASSAQDELGDTARAVDAMALALQMQSSALRASEQRLRTIADNLPALIAYVDKSEHYRFTNRQYTKLLGQDAQSYLNKSISQVLGETARRNLATYIEAVLNGERQDFERRGMGLMPSSTFSVNYIPDINARGQVDGFYIMAMDITTRKQAEVDLKASERRLYDITNNVPALVSYLDRGGRFRFANFAHRDLLGIDPQALLGQTLRDSYGAANYGDIRGHIDATMNGDAVKFEHRLETPRGARHFEVATVPQRDDDGKVQGMYMLTQDITERKLVELERSNRQRDLESSLREKEVLLKEIHHRVKNNLQVISSLLQLQASYVQDPAAKLIFEESQGRIKSMALVHEKLYQAKDFAHIDFGEYVRDLVSGLSGSHGGHGALVRIDVDASAIQLDVDRAIPAGLVINELVANSFKHGFPGGRAGRVRVGLHGGGDQPIRLSVGDDGVGWAPGFDPKKSSSLGLRLVHILAKQLRADLHVDTVNGVQWTLDLQPELETA